MNNENIIFNHTLEQYNKKYKNRKHRLVKFTKSQVEDFDKLHNTEKGYLLKGRKWCLIKDTYYEIPKAPRFTWFRNLNAGVQTAVCVLGAGVVATAVTVPLVLLNNHETVVEHEAVVDPEVTGVTLSQKKLDNGSLEITMSYDTSKKELSNLEIYIGNEKLQLNKDYTLDGNKIVINKDALQNNKEKKITVKPTLKDKEEPTHEVTKAEWVKAADALFEVFSSSSKEYKVNQISNFQYGESTYKTPSNVIYEGTGENREFYIQGSSTSNKIRMAAKDTSSGTYLKDYLVDTGKYIIGNDYIEYTCENAPNSKYKKVVINKYGYIVEAVAVVQGKEFITKATYTGEPQPKQETEKEKFIRLYTNYRNTFLKSTAIYSLADINSFIYNKGQKTVTKIAYTELQGLRNCYVVADGLGHNITISSDELAPEDLTSKLTDEDTYTFDDITGNIKVETKIGSNILVVNKFGYIIENSSHGYSITFTNEPHEETAKEKWIKKADELNKTFLESKLEYTSDQLIYKFNDSSISFTDFKYGTAGSGNRTLSISVGGAPMIIADDSYSGTYLDGVGTLDKNGTYTINNDGIIYKYDNASDYYYKELHINKYGYPTYIRYSNGVSDQTREYIYNGDPKEPAVHKTALQYKPGESGDNSITYVGTPQASVDAGTQSLKIKCTLNFVGVVDGTLYVYDNPEFSGVSLANSESITGPMSYKEHTFTIDISSINLNNYETLYVEAFIG